MKTPNYSNHEQTVQINELLGANESYFTVADVFNYLPHKIKHNGCIGFLTISKIDIYWTSLELGYRGSVVALFQHLDNRKNIFDSFISALKWLQNTKNIEILEE